MYIELSKQEMFELRQAGYTDVQIERWNNVLYRRCKKMFDKKLDTAYQMKR